MEFWDQQILPRLNNVAVIEWFTFGVNALVFLFSKKIASSYGQVKEQSKMRSRLRLLHGFNLVVFITFILSIATKTDRLPAEPSVATVNAQLEAAQSIYARAETSAQVAEVQPITKAQIAEVIELLTSGKMDAAVSRYAALAEVSEREATEMIAALPILSRAPSQPFLS